MNRSNTIAFLILGLSCSFPINAELAFRVHNTLPKACKNEQSISVFYSVDSKTVRKDVKSNTSTNTLYAQQIDPKKGWPYIGIQENVEIPCSELSDIDAQCKSTGVDNACLNVSVNNTTCAVTVQDCQYPPFKVTKDYPINGALRYQVVGTKDTDGVCLLTVQRIPNWTIPPKQQDRCP